MGGGFAGDMAEPPTSKPKTPDGMGRDAPIIAVYRHKG
jgi:hypothetical protein